MRVRSTLLPLLALMLLVGAAVAPAAAPARRVPFGFFGTFSDVSWTGLPASTQRGERNVMVRSGVESVRILVNWQSAQRHRDFSEIPVGDRHHFTDVGGIPTDFRNIDASIGLYASRGLRVLPVVVFSPPWASTNAFVPGAEPRDLPAYGRFLAALAQRYGPRGTFWRNHKAPRSARIRRWQIWNEMDHPYNWGNGARRFAPDYVRMLREARRALKRVDPGAKLVLGGLTSNTAWPRLWDALDAVYRAGGRGLFDVAAVHPYTRTPEGVLQILRRTRAVMNRHGDRRTPLLVTEFGWASGRGRVRRGVTWVVSPSQQAKNLSRAYSLFAANRRRLRLEAAYWYSWLTTDREPYWSHWTGLRRRQNPRRIVSKPAFGAFARLARRYEGCSKRLLANRCG